MHRYRRLMVGLTRTETDAGLIRYAAMIAQLGTATEIRFVHVLPNSADPVTTQDHDRVQAELRAEVQPHFTGVPEAAEVTYDVLPGPLIDRLLAHVAEKQVDLLLVGHRRNHPGRWALARRLAMNASCSVWMVPENAPAALQRILVPIDFSDHAADCMRVATSMAWLSGHTECLALNVYFNEQVLTYEDNDPVRRGQEEQAYREFIAPINCLGVQVTPLFVESANITHAISEAAQWHGVDLIVLATRGRSQSAAILLGSVAEQLIIETRVPLLAVKHFGAQMGVLEVLLNRRFWKHGDLHTA